MAVAVSWKRRKLRRSRSSYAMFSADRMDFVPVAELHSVTAVLITRPSVSVPCCCVTSAWTRCSIRS